MSGYDIRGKDGYCGSGDRPNDRPAAPQIRARVTPVGSKDVLRRWDDARMP